MQSYLSTKSDDWAKAYSANATDTSFTSLIPTTTKPSGSGVIQWRNIGDDTAPNAILFEPYGTGADNSTFDFRLIGWSAAPAPGLTTLWRPTRLFAATATLSAMVGIAGAALIETERSVDTIASVVSWLSAVEYSSPTGDLQASVLIDGLGFELLQFSVDLTGATGANFLYRRV
jgi:hypothetical protein